MKRKYKYLIFDIDDTLLDFYCAFLSAQEKVSELLGIPCSEEFRKLDEKTGWKAWNEMHLDDTDNEDIQNNYHSYYCEYLRLHYEYLLAELRIELDVEKVVDCYESAISTSVHFKEDCTLSVLKMLSEHYKLVLATNGMVKIQERRVDVFKPYVNKVYISEAMQVIKPSTKFYEYILRDLKCEPEECLMIGDSITNDIVGAKSVGMDVCYFNPKNKTVKPDILCDYNIHSINDLCMILMEKGGDIVVTDCR